jgi:polyhydroxybutyrate depolymerase
MRIVSQLKLCLAVGTLLAVTAVSGCAGAGAHVAGPPSSPVLPVGSSTHSIEVGGVSRTYLVYRPASGWDAEADREHFAVAYPDGLGHAWNTGGGCCGTPGRTNADDTGFITAMVSAIERQLPVDAARVYATGISNGGIMAYTLACRTAIFAAIGPDSATELGSCPAPHPLSVIHIHGTADTRIR